MRKNHALQGQSSGNRNLQVVPSALRATTVRCHGADDGEPQCSLQSVDRDDQGRSTPSLLMADGRVGVDLDEITLG